MADNKESFLFYTKWINTFRSLPKEKGYDLLMHILSYVNDEDPKTDDILINAVFQNIQLDLKVDLKKWELSVQEKSNGGSVGNLKRWHLPTYNKYIKGKITLKEAFNIAYNRTRSHTDDMRSHPIAKIAVNVNVNDYTNSIDIRKLSFSKTLIPFIEKYGKDTVREFFNYWTEPNKSKTKMKFEIEKTWSSELRLARWCKSDFNNSNKKDFKATDQSNNANLFGN